MDRERIALDLLLSQCCDSLHGTGAGPGVAQCHVWRPARRMPLLCFASMRLHPPVSSEPLAPAPSDRAHGDRGRVRGNHVALGIAIGTLAVLAVRALFPLWLPLLLAAWSANLARPLSHRLEPWLRGKRRAASLAAVLLVVIVL